MKQEVSLNIKVHTCLWRFSRSVRIVRKGVIPALPSINMRLLYLIHLGIDYKLETMFSRGKIIIVGNRIMPFSMHLVDV